MSEVATPRLRLSGISKYFPGVRALTDVSMELAAGEIHGLVGENGAGKSTLVGVASGALAPEEGTVEINGVAVSASPEQARALGFAIVRQEPSLMPDLTVAENMIIGQPQAVRPRMHEMNNWALSQLKRWSPDVEIAVTDRVQGLPSEHRFIVEITKALAANPGVLILDEPTEHLSAPDVERLFERVRLLAAAGTAIVYISHRIREVQRIAHRVTVLRDGHGRGTYRIDEVDEQQIVNLIVGRDLDREFPAKDTVAAEAAPILEVQNLSGPGFADVSLAMRKGEIVGLAGIDANGQREFIRALAGFGANRGEVRLLGARVDLGSIQRAAVSGIQYLPGDRHVEGIIPDLSVRENFSLRSLDRNRVLGFVQSQTERERAVAAVKRFAVKTPGIETPIGLLSGGNQQKIMLASVLESEPTLMLIDEPTQGVDVGTRMEIYRILRNAARQGIGIIVLSSDAGEIAGLCDRVLIFSRGQVVRELAGEDVTENDVISAVLTATTVRDRGRMGVGALTKWLAGDIAPIVLIASVLFLLGAYASYVNEFYFTARNFSGMFALIATLAIASFGQQIVMLVGGIDLSVGPLMGLLVVVASFFLVDDASAATQAGGWVLMVAVAVLAGLANWALIEILLLHPMVATLATYMSIQAISLILRPIPGGFITDRVMDGLGTRLGFVPVAFLVAAAMAVALEYCLFRSRLGLSLRALGSRQEAARVAGISPRAVRCVAYVACSLFALLAALPMMTQVGSGDPSAGTSYTLTSIAAVVIGGASLFGGRGSFVGAILGAFLITQVNVVTAFLNFDAAAQNYLLGAMIVLAVAVYSKSRQLEIAK